MLILVRQIRMRDDRVVDQRDLELATDRLRVGSGKDQDLQLFGPDLGAEHAVLQPTADGGLRIECKGGHQIVAGERDVGRTTLARDEWARIGPHRLAAVAAPPGFDAALEIRIDADAAPTIRDRLGDELALKSPRVRAWSYILLLLVVGLGLALPLLGYYHDDVAATLADYGGPTDVLWSSGPLAAAHHAPGIADDCNVCHVEPFQRVPDSACLECHEDTAAHMPAAPPAIDGFDGNCRDCHEEHNEPANLIVRHDGQCTDCHADTRERVDTDGAAIDGMPVAAAPDTVQPATAFDRDGHPRFLAALPHFDGEDWRVHRQRLGAEDTAEASNLKFPHDVHMDHDKVSLADGPSREDRALQCSDCHQLAAQGEHFQPVTMEATCSGCHTLAFDDAQPDRQLPHGEPAALRTYLEEYYVRQAALHQRAAPPEPARRVPNSPAAYRCEGEPLDCGEAWADREMDRLFNKAGCVSCHEVEREDGKWTVRPVRLVRDWYPGARFDHRPHLNPGAAADAGTCADCHAAENSSEATDVLMPSLDNCVQCHASEADTGLATRCLDCHRFHRPGLPAMGEH